MVECGSVKKSEVESRQNVVEPWQSAVETSRTK